MRYFIFFLSLAMIFSSCNIIDGRRVKGNGKIITKTYDLKNFKSIDASGVIHIYLKQDSVYKVQVETDENLISFLRVDNVDGELQVGNKNHVNLSPSNEIKVLVSMPVLNSLTLSGASLIKGSGRFSQNDDMAIETSGASEGEIEVRAPKVSLTASGASTLNISGETKDIKADASGASTIKAFELKSENAVVDASGASTTNVFASISIKADASGASSVHYKGNPKVSADASGASSVKKAD